MQNFILEFKGIHRLKIHSFLDSPDWALRFACIFTILLIYGCTSEDSGSEIPIIRLLNVSKTTMVQGDLNQDSIWLKFEFEDGDGDLGFGSNDIRQDIFVHDERTGNLHGAFKLPDLPQLGSGAQKGTISILLFTSCCIFPDNIPPCSTPLQYPVDTLIFSMYLTDRANHKSDTLQSGPLVLFCK